MTLTVNITQKEIDLGVPNNECSCPIALSLHALGYENCLVKRTAVMLDKSIQKWFLLPQSVRDFIFRFDNHGVESPLTFEIIDT